MSYATLYAFGCTPSPRQSRGPGRACRLRPLICPPAGSVGPHIRIIAARKTERSMSLSSSCIQSRLHLHRIMVSAALHKPGAPAYCIKMCALSRPRNVRIKQMVPPLRRPACRIVKCTSGSGILCGESTITTLPRKTLASIRAALGFRSAEVIRVSSRLRHNSMSCSLAHLWN